MTDKNTSTLQSYIDSATGAAQSALGSLTGNTADKREADQRRAEADAKRDLSQAGGTFGGVSVASSGVAPHDPGRQEGSWNKTLGAGKQTLGGLVGNEALRQDGQRQNEQGQAQEAQGQLSDLGKGIGDRAQGAVQGAVGGIVGDREMTEQAQRTHDHGKTLQRGAEHDIQKQAPQ